MYKRSDVSDHPGVFDSDSDIRQRKFRRVRPRPLSLSLLNLENHGNVRQTRWDPLVRPSRAADGRWTVGAWAPLDGFVANAGLRLLF